MVKYNFSKSKVNRIKFYLLLGFTFLIGGLAQAQSITEIPSTDVFSPDFEEVESMEYGIILYDQYANFNPEPKIRKKANGEPVNGKVEDLSSNNLLIHKGYYQDGKLRGYTNYFPNESTEREYKYKADGVGDLYVFFLNGYTRSVQKYYNFAVYHWEDYYDNGQLAYVESKGKKTGIPELIQENNYQGVTVKKIEISDNKNLKYIQTITLGNGKLSEQGELVYIEEIQDFRKDGRWVTYDKTEQVTSEIVYQKGEFKEVISDIRPDSEKTYLNVVENTTNESEVETEVKSSIPSNIARFDQDNNNEITSKEIDMAVNEFFEDDSITRAQINELVNFFFEQD